MAVTVRVSYRGTVSSPFDLERTFAYFRDFEKAIPTNFPGLERFAGMPPDAYRWTFEGVSYGGYEIKLDLATRFSIDTGKRIGIEPVSGSGNGELRGQWRFAPKGNGTEVHFEAELQGDLPVPFFLKTLAVSVAQKELTKVFDTYLSNVEKALTA